MNYPKKQFTIFDFQPSPTGLIIKKIQSFDHKIQAEQFIGILKADTYYCLTIMETYTD